MMHPEEFKVSVVIPVYNAAAYVRKAVESALVLSDVGEVILIEDGSPDRAIEECQQIISEFENVRLYRHPNGENLGAGASRNLGIQKAAFQFIAFLDADDWYLPNRFKADREILLSDLSIDGVYNALGNHYESEEMRQQWLSQGRAEVLTLTAPPTPEELPLILLHAHPTIRGEFSTDTITVRREFFQRVGLFNTKLRLQQDTHMWKRMSAIGRLGPGSLVDPVCIRRVHPNNRMTKREDHKQYLDIWWSDLGRCFREARVRPEIMQAWRRGYSSYLAGKNAKIGALISLASWTLRDPRQLCESYGHFDQIIRRVGGNSQMVNRALSAKNRLLSKR